MEDTREIVSVRFGSIVIFGRVVTETSKSFVLDDGDLENGEWPVFKEKGRIIHRNLAATPHEDFGRKCEVNEPHSTFPWTLIDQQGEYIAFKDNDGSLRHRGFNRHITFLDETPKTIEIGGNKYNQTDIDKICPCLTEKLAELEPVEKP